jgi:hypothetical protein
MWYLQTSPTHTDRWVHGKVLKALRPTLWTASWYVFADIRTEGPEFKPSESQNFYSELLDSVYKHGEHQADWLGPSILSQLRAELNALFLPTVWYIQESPWGLDACCPWGHKLDGMWTKWTCLALRLQSSLQFSVAPTHKEGEFL